MRILGFKSYPLLKDLINSNIVGERLAAIAILQAKPDLLVQSNAKYLDWIVSRVAEEKPFVGYHATKTLLAAAYYPNPPYPKEDLQKAIKLAMEALGENLRASDRYTNLINAQKVLSEF